MGIGSGDESGGIGRGGWTGYWIPALGGQSQGRDEPRRSINIAEAAFQLVKRIASVCRPVGALSGGGLGAKGAKGQKARWERGRTRSLQKRETPSILTVCISAPVCRLLQHTFHPFQVLVLAFLFAAGPSLFPRSRSLRGPAYFRESG